jgi:hypothetical protein
MSYSSSSSSHNFVGLDLGQARDHTAVCVIQRDVDTGVRFDYVRWLRTQYESRPEYCIRYLERLPLQVAYPDVVNAVDVLMGSLEGPSTLIVDATGVGAPVVDLFLRARLRCEILPVVITPGHTQTVSPSAPGGRLWHHVPKRDLVLGLQLALQQQKLSVAEGLAHFPHFSDELRSMQLRLTPAGNTQFGVWREGKHDDLVLAAALATWRMQVRTVGPKGDGNLCYPLSAPSLVH